MGRDGQTKSDRGSGTRTLKLEQACSETIGNDAHCMHPYTQARTRSRKLCQRVPSYAIKYDNAEGLVNRQLTCNKCASHPSFPATDAESHKCTLRKLIICFIALTCCSVKWPDREKRWWWCRLRCSFVEHMLLFYLLFWRCFGLFQRHKPTELAHPLLFCFCVYFCFYGPFNCSAFQHFFRQLSAFSLCSFGLNSVLLVLSTIHFFMNVSLIPGIILCGWLGLKHQLTN